MLCCDPLESELGAKCLVIGRLPHPPVPPPVPDCPKIKYRYHIVQIGGIARLLYRLTIRRCGPVTAEPSIRERHSLASIDANVSPEVAMTLACS